MKMHYEQTDHGFLSHHGIKGQKWGVRRYQNEDGTLTPAGKKRASKEYKKASDAVVSDLNRNSTKLYVESHNKAADYMNRKGTEEFNRKQEKKYGKNYANRSGYEEDYLKTFDKVFTDFANQTLNDFYKSNKNYQKAKSLVEKYGLTEWDDLARSNEKVIKDLQDAVNKQRKYR